ncbi:AAA family ATPase [Butyrivibrio sp. WCE2006]|uniref:AAA family ATPase n=1 Tax=Butyrivibrio sp. WCE2006 TaxID=1410611 RepID=UPI000A898B95|nr:AAA family ATPase [Butyrivibrio sp. WCE2006]
MSNSYLGNMYNDFFGPGSGGDGKPPKFDDPKKEAEITKQVSEDFERVKDGKDIIGVRKSEDKGILGKIQSSAQDKNKDDKKNNKAITSADEALNEARALFNNADKPVPPMPTATTTSDPVKQEQPKEKEPETDPMEDLNGLIGLSSIKHDVKELTDFAKVQKMRKDEGMKSVPVSLHLVFTGNPGTGKTTVARIISRIYKQIGVLSSGQLIEVDRSGLVAGYVGQTALKTQEKINQALGGVLFIDEAYALSQENDAFGQEAIDTILKAMEDHRDDLVVIVAGYTKPMEKFINSNPGLKSRFNKYIEFPDYSVDELEEIFNMNLNKYEYELEEDAKKHVREMISQRKLSRLENFANAREIRNLFEEIVTNQARRIAQLENPTAEQIRIITSEDLLDKSLEDEKKAETASAKDEKKAETSPVEDDKKTETSLTKDEEKAENSLAEESENFDTSLNDESEANVFSEADKETVEEADKDTDESAVESLEQINTAGDSEEETPTEDAV